MKKRGGSAVAGAGWKAVVLGMCGALAGCGVLVTADATRGFETAPPADSSVVAVFGRSYEPAAEAASRFAAMAVFSQAVYREDIPVAERWGAACSYLRPGASVPAVGMPVGPEGRWSRWAGHPRACIDEVGLAYETYIHQRVDGAVTAAVIAFRGTENVRGQLAHDWGSNLLVTLGIEPPEYRRAQQPVSELVSALDAAWPGIAIYATGHSLGGGLAQQAAYLSDKIKAVYAFNSSPVTNWSNLAIKDRFARQEGRQAVIKQANPMVYRVYHRHEGLAYLRDAAGRFVSRNLNRRDYEFHFKDGTVIESHSMALLACNLALAFRGPSADFGFTREFALQVTGDDYPSGAGDNPICPEDTRRHLRRSGAKG